MKKKEHTRLILKDNFFGVEARKVHDALFRSNPHDKGVQRFARRAARAITAFEGGFVHKARPLGAFLIFGSPHAPLLEYAATLAETWLGSRTDGELPYLYVDCLGARNARGTTEFTRLTGPPTVYPNYPFIRLPLLAEQSLIGTDFSNRRGAEEKALRDFQEKFIADHNDLWQKLGGMPPLILQRFTQERQRIYEEGKPYRSVVIFDNLEFALPDLISDVIRPTLHPASLQTLGMSGIEVTSFTTSIIILIMHDQWNWLKINENPLGFAKPAENGLSDEKYRTIRQNLLENPLFSGLTHDIADSLILMGFRTSQQQKTQFKERFEEFKRKFETYAHINITWTEAFLEMMIEESFDQDLGFFTQRRTDRAFEKYVEHPLAHEVAQKEIRHKSIVSFDMEEDTDKKVFSPSYSIQNGEGEPLTPQEVTAILEKEARKEPDASSAEKESSSFEFLNVLQKDPAQLILSIENQLDQQSQSQPSQS